VQYRLLLVQQLAGEGCGRLVLLLPVLPACRLQSPPPHLSPHLSPRLTLPPPQFGINVKAIIPKPVPEGAKPGSAGWEVEYSKVDDATG
jgi:hypothetical protein